MENFKTKNNCDKNSITALTTQLKTLLQNQKVVFWKSYKDGKTLIVD